MKVAILTYNSSALFELGCAAELFALERPEFEQWYQTDIVCLDPGPHHSIGGLQIQAKQITSLEAYDMLVVPSWPTNITQVKGVIADEIRAFALTDKRMISFCSGAFLLASLGLLDNRLATTHWRYAAKFKQRYPKAQYVDNVLYVYDGTIGCSAGSAAALDLGLEIIRQDFGQDIANQVARRLVVSAHRKGGQAQYVPSPRLKASDKFASAIEWAMANINTKFSIDALADKASMSRRSFDRNFKQTYQQTPGEWLIQQRLSLAKELLERSSRAENMERIAAASGFDNATSMRHHFRKSLGVSPRQFRDQFAA